MKKFYTLVLILMTFFLVSCGKSEINTADTGGTDVYYLNADKTKLISKPYEIKSTETGDQISELLGQLKESDNKQYIPPIFDEIQLEKYEINGYTLYLYFTTDYYKLPIDVEVLSRAAIVKTLIQLDNISNINFMVNGIALNDSYGNPIPPMDKNSFVENIGTDINSYQTMPFTLFFAGPEGKKLVQVTKNITYLSSLPKERVVMDALISGPGKDLSHKAVQTVPAGIKINSIITKNGVCYLDLNDKAVVGDNISGKMFIYSVVNSLTELPGISKVKISLNSDDSSTFKEVPLDTAFEHNDSIVKKKK